MIAGRKVEPDFAKFYVEQVKLGAITVDTHGKNEAVFYGTSKEYLGEPRPAPSTIFNNSILYVLIPPNLKMVLGDWIIQKLIPCKFCLLF